MDHIRVIRRAFEIVRRYPVLWIFGFLLALTTSRGGSPNNGYQFSERDFRGENGSGIPLPRDFHWPQVPQVANDIIGIIIGILCLFLLLGVVFTIVRYVAETSAIRMVDRYEASGEKHSFRQGWRLGWSRAAFRMWLIDLLFGLGAFLVVLVILAVAAAPLLLWTTQNDVAGIIGTAAAVSLGIIAILVLIALGTVLSLLGIFFHRAAALENLGVFDSIRRGWQIVRRRPGDAIIMGLILFGLGLLFGILMIPLVLIAIFIGVMVGGVPALLMGALTNMFAHGATPQIVALAVGIPIFLAVLILPLAFISGLFEIFSSSTWTLAYREMVALETTQAPA